MRSLIITLLAATALAPVAASFAAAPATTTDSAAPATRGGITVNTGSGRVIHLREGAANVFTADPKIAEVRPASPDSLFIFGVAPGTTTVAALTQNGQAIAQFQVTVLPSTFDATQAHSAIGGAAKGRVLVKENDTGLSVSGNVGTPGDADRVVNAAKGVLPPEGKIDDELRVTEPTQISLHVRIAEMNRTLTRDLGVNWSANTAGKGYSYTTPTGTTGTLPGLGASVSTGTEIVNPNALTPTTAVLGGVNHLFNGLEAIIDALSEDQLIHILAEPNLTTMSGEPATFLAGGEFPIPIATSQNTISLQFKQYGISLSFVPTVIAHDQIILHVRPEVSQLDKADGVTFLLGTGGSTASGVSIPALTVRRADTTVQLGSGQSFVIAGLLQDQTTLTGNSVPGLGDVPILGALFRSDSFQRNESELVIVVTPYIVKPVNDPNALHLPTDGWRPPNDIERILMLRQSATGSFKSERRMPADAGFMVE
jgi:pilus assembly protein CpaC